MKQVFLVGLPRGGYGAQMGNDDTVMTVITATEFFNTTDYADYIEELLRFYRSGSP